MDVDALNFFFFLESALFVILFMYFRISAR